MYSFAYMVHQSSMCSGFINWSRTISETNSSINSLCEHACSHGAGVAFRHHHHHRRRHLWGLIRYVCIVFATRIAQRIGYCFTINAFFDAFDVWRARLCGAFLSARRVELSWPQFCFDFIGSFGLAHARVFMWICFYFLRVYSFCFRRCADCFLYTSVVYDYSSMHTTYKL